MNCRLSIPCRIASTVLNFMQNPEARTQRLGIDYHGQNRAKSNPAPKAARCGLDRTSAHRKSRASYCAIVAASALCWLMVIISFSPWPSSSRMFYRSKLLMSPSDAPAHVAMLEMSTMWGLGADARRHMKRRAHVPLAIWSQDAIKTLKQRYWQLQDPRACDRVLYIYPMFWGLTSQMRDYSDAAIIALGTDRTIHFVSDGWRPQYCAEDAWLECFFKPMSGRMCRRAGAELRAIPPFQPSGVSDLISKLKSDEPVVHLVAGRHFDFIVGSSLGFPSELWRRLLDSGNVRLLDRSGERMNTTALEQEDGELYHTLALSALRTMLAMIMFEPNDEIKALAAARADAIMSTKSARRHRACVAVHLRWTDKKNDGGVAAKMNFTADHVSTGLDRLEHLTGHSYRCILLLSDDDESAVPALGALLGESYDIRPVSRVRDLFPNQEDYDIYKERGHTHVRDFFSSRDPKLAYAYTREVFIDIQTAVLAEAEYLIGPGSSGVSQLLSQYMGARRGVDANAVALWQEDILMVGVR